MNRPRVSTFRSIVIGLLLGLLLAPLQARAQITVYDPANYAVQTAWKLEEANRWVETITHYARVVEYQIKQWLTLKDVLTNAERLVSHNVAWANTMAGIGRSIRAVYQLKASLQNLVRLRIVALKNIHQRLERGIFDPEADLEDLDEYLRSGIGREAAARLAKLERLASFDNTLQTLYERWQRACATRAGLETQYEKAKERLAALERDGTCPACISDTKAEINSIEEQLIEVKRLIDEIWKDLTARAARYHVRINEEQDFAREVAKMDEAWDRFLVIKQEGLDRLDRWAIDREGMRPRRVAPPADLGPVLHQPTPSTP